MAWSHTSLGISANLFLDRSEKKKDYKSHIFNFKPSRQKQIIHVLIFSFEHKDRKKIQVKQLFCFQKTVQTDI